jgi:glycerol uptake facilitator-like aquaporin
MPSRSQRLAAEFGGTAFLLAVVVGSGIMAQRLSAGNEAMALLANSIATGAGLYALLAALLKTQANFNPAVTLLAVWQRRIGSGFGAACISAQFTGAVAGVIVTHAMFGEPLLQASARDRMGLPLAFSELIATCGLLALLSLSRKATVAGAVAAYITAAYWFTASTSFANPAVTVARAMTDSFTGIAWSAVPGFVAAQLLAVLIVAVVTRVFRQAR